MINLTSSEDIDKYQNDIIKQMMSLEQIFAKSINPIIDKQYLDAANLVELGTFNVNAPVNKQVEVLHSIFLANYKRISTIFLNLTNRYILDSSKGLNSIHTKIDISKEEFLRILRLWISEQVANKVVLVNNITKQLIQKIIDKGMLGNKTIKEIAKDIRKISGITNKTRAMTIAITETHTAAVYTMDKYIINTGLVIGRRWLSAKDERTRRPLESEFNHLGANGEVVGVNEKFIRTGESLDYPGDPNGSPGNIINCFPAGTIISGVSPLAVTRQWYEGELIEITSSRGHKLTGTPNHPILTVNGWCALDKLNNGNSIYSSTYSQKSSLFWSNPNINNIETTIEKIFNSFSNFGEFNRVSSTIVNFHGQIPNHDVDVITTNRKLRNTSISKFIDPFFELGFTSSNFREIFEFATCYGMYSFFCMYLMCSFYSKIGFFSEQASFFNRSVFHSIIHRFGSISMFDSILMKYFINCSSLDFQNIGNSLDRFSFIKQFNYFITVLNSFFYSNNFERIRNSSNNIRFFENEIDCHRSTFKLNSNFFNTFSSLIELDNINFVRRIKFRGHVYNLQDRKGFYLANGIFSHNCRCVLCYDLKKK